MRGFFVANFLIQAYMRRSGNNDLLLLEKDDFICGKNLQGRLLPYLAILSKAAESIIIYRLRYNYV